MGCQGGVRVGEDGAEAGFQARVDVGRRVPDHTGTEYGDGDRDQVSVLGQPLLPGERIEIRLGGQHAELRG